MDYSKKQPLTKEELDKRAMQIIALHLDEIEAHALARSNGATSEERMEALEDGYLANLKMIKLAKEFTKEQYVTYQLDRQCGCDHGDLNIPEWDEYIS
jgi:hypothetical protein